MSNKLTKYSSFWICLALVIVTAAVYCQVRSYEFVNYDDPGYVYKNPDVQKGLTYNAVKWAFTTNCVANWHPLTWISHILDWQLYGSSASGHHITNLIFHIANTLLLFIVLRQMTSALWPSAFVAALFALHPLHVESVAWVAERKDVLSTFFWMLTMWAYVRYVNRPKTGRYLLVIVFFALGLMSKPMLVTLPFILLLLDYWPLKRLESNRSLIKLLIEKIPLFILVLASCVVTFIAQKKSGAMPSIEEHGLSVRFANAFISYLQYIIKMVWPVRLAVFYPHSGPDISVLYAFVSACLLLAVTVFILRFCKNHRYLVTGWFWYLGTLIPVIGLVQVGVQAMADRYSYITLTGLFIIIAWGLPELLGKWRYRKILLWAFSLMVLSALAVCTYFQLQYWKNSITLFQHSLRVTGSNCIMHYCISEPLVEQGRIKEAVLHLQESLRIKPDEIGPMNNLAWFLAAGRETEVHNPDRAVKLARRVCELTDYKKPEFLDTLAVAYAASGDFSKAIETTEKALRLCQSSDQEMLKKELESHLALYKAGKPYIEDEQ
jgi:protein O-mannosyl-transferase